MQGPRLGAGNTTSYSNVTATSGDQNMLLMSNSSACSNAEIKSTLMLFIVTNGLPLLMKFHAFYMIRRRDDEVSGGSGACMTRAVARGVRQII